MSKSARFSLFFLAAMALLSLTGLLGLPLSGASVIVGVVAFFVDKALQKQPYKGSGLDAAAFIGDLKNGPIWAWILLPVAMNVVAVLLAKAVLPEFVQHVSARTGGILASNQLPLVFVTLAVTALGEEIAWRAFFQRQAELWTRFGPALLIGSALFSVAHIAAGSPVVVAYDLLFVFINSLLYGIVFKKTNNALVSALSHLIANLSALLLIGLI